jgi:hypothetical protein
VYGGRGGGNVTGITEREYLSVCLYLKSVSGNRLNVLQEATQKVVERISFWSIVCLYCKIVMVLREISVYSLVAGSTIAMLLGGSVKNYLSSGVVI